MQLDTVYHGEAMVTVDERDQKEVSTPKRLLVEKTTEEDETVEEMVQQLEGELEEEFAFLCPTVAPTIAAVKEVPA